MCLATTHGLLEFEDALTGLAFQSAETLFEEGLHAFGDVVLPEEFVWLDAVPDQIGDVQDSVPAARVKDAAARSANSQLKQAIAQAQSIAALRNVELSTSQAIAQVHSDE